MRKKREKEIEGARGLDKENEGEGGLRGERKATEEKKSKKENE